MAGWRSQPPWACQARTASRIDPDDERAHRREERGGDRRTEAELPAGSQHYRR